MQTEHEADRTTSVMMDKALNEACILTGDILQRMVNMFAGLRVFPQTACARISTSAAA